MTHSQLFLVFAVVSVAPHLKEADAKLINVISIVIATVFLAIELWAGGKS